MVCFQERLRRDQTEDEDDFWLDNLDLLDEVGKAGLSFRCLWVPVFGWSAFQDVADIGFASFDIDGGEHFIQEFSGFADKRSALFIFFGTGSFSDNHDARPGVSFAKNAFIPALRQITFLAIGT